MSKENKINFLSELILAEEDGKVKIPKKIQVLKAGTFNHPWMGKFKITPEQLKEMEKNFNNRVRKIDLAVDLGHNNGEDAAGWFKSVELKNNGKQLWAEIDWTDLGEEKISTKRYRYLSAEYHTEYEDNETGKLFGHVLLGAGLTNRPFLKGMKATSKLSEEKVMEKKILELEGSVKTLGDEKVTLQDTIKKLSEEKENLTKENKELKDKIELSEKEASFNKLLDEGKVVPAQKEAYMANDFAKYAELSGKKEVNLKENGSGQTLPEGGKKLADEDDLYAAAVILAEESKVEVERAISILLDKPEYEHLNK
ncbi:MAG: hypothetical protein KAS32_09060 [Candidatus Peribacteraceae bacterium]|nr:hypothetical protein [Candidatus Peribacteraceae bacterium]